jgi:hypothetical protein
MAGGSFSDSYFRFSDGHGTESAVKAFSRLVSGTRGEWWKIR